MKTAITIMIMLYFQLCHKPKHLRGILRQPVKPKHSWALLSPLGMFHHEMSNSCYTEESRRSWVIERRLLSLRDESHRGDLLKSGCNGRFHGTPRRPHGTIAHDPQVLRDEVLPDLRSWPAAASHTPQGTPFPSSPCSCSHWTSLPPEPIGHQALDHKVLGSWDCRCGSSLQRAFPHPPAHSSFSHNASPYRLPSPLLGFLNFSLRTQFCVDSFQETFPDPMSSRDRDIEMFLSWKRSQKSPSSAWH